MTERINIQQIIELRELLSEEFGEDELLKAREEFQEIYQGDEFFQLSEEDQEAMRLFLATMRIHPPPIMSSKS